ncbi:MAG: DUF1854 domain-containing protein [Clostridia bacterium]|nr:DUF1854 domain-containing protein [Clostridia bacterium]
MNPEINDTVIDLFQHRKSVPLSPQNATFFRSEGGMVSLTLRNEDGSEETFERVAVIRAFPITNPDDFLSVREPGKGGSRGDEIGLIETISLFDAETVALLNEELDRRYFIPEITKIYSMKEKYGYHYTEAQTSAGRVQFVMNNPSNNIRTLEDGRVLITDTDGNCFCLPDPTKLDKQSYRIIEIYL